jgi:4-hydroxyproline epimerase
MRGLEARATGKTLVMSTRIKVIDTHTAGEPTRVIVSGGPDLGGGSVAQRLAVFREKYDHVRSGVVNEPRGSDVVVGALLCEPSDKSCAAGVIFFNNVGILGMCGHGTIGLVATLAHAGHITPGEHYIETPVGIVRATLHEDLRVSVRNVPSYRHARGVNLHVPGCGDVTGDVAWGGNWFFLVTSEHHRQLDLRHVEALTDYTWRIRQALVAAGITGAEGAEIDHVELYGPPSDSRNQSRNFVLCPGKAYDRSPCGTGTSAKLACLYADGKIKPGDLWRQEGILGSVFEGSVAIVEGAVVPTITGTACVMAESTLIFEEGDPFQWGIR